ncbi:DUF418 domain-containing protein [Massilia arenae]|nr:DUF418 domain-containing protein [Massilia arenae]
MPPSSSRISLVDALRGFAILAIMLLHNIERFDLYGTPAWTPAWLAALDKGIWSAAFFLFGGKAYAIFAFLFGFTFALQFDKRAALGQDFRPRFVWRMFLLLCFGLVNSLFYHGDILSIYAVLAMSLLPVARLGNRALLIVATILLLQPLAWLDLFHALPAAATTLADPASWAHFSAANVYLMHGTLLDVWIGNLTNGKTAAILWSWENGRILQIPALLMLGMLACRTRLFDTAHDAAARWRRIGLGALLAFTLLFLASKSLDGWIAAEGVRRPLQVIVTSWSNLAFATLLVASFVALYTRKAGAGLLSRLAPMGRMSLTSYIAQSLIGTTLYYGFGLGLYQFTGAGICLAIGIALATMQIRWSSWWLQRHAQGPLESLWHRATWIGQRPAAPSAQAGRH